MTEEKDILIWTDCREAETLLTMVTGMGELVSHICLDVGIRYAESHDSD